MEWNGIKAKASMCRGIAGHHRRGAGIIAPTQPAISSGDEPCEEIVEATTAYAARRAPTTLTARSESHRRTGASLVRRLPLPPGTSVDGEEMALTAACLDLPAGAESSAITKIARCQLHFLPGIRADRSIHHAM
jgi:hypothetical protein